MVASRSNEKEMRIEWKYTLHAIDCNSQAWEKMARRVKTAQKAVNRPAVLRDNVGKT